MLQAAIDGLGLVIVWPNILYPVIGTLLAMVVSFLPGISGVTLMALALPLTFSWSPLEVVLLFGALVGGATFMGSVTAILFNVPGTAPSAATMLDGHPLAQQGAARMALGCAATASALGSTIGVGILIGLLPVVRPLLLSFGPLEFLLLCVWGLTTVAMVGGSPMRAWAMAGLGLTLAFIGRDPRTADPRFTFGADYLAPAGGTPADEEKAREMIGALKPEDVLAYSQGAIKALAAHPQANGKAGAVGFCWGGGMVNALAVADPTLAAGVAYYGRQPDAAAVPAIKAPLLLHYGGLDERINAGIADFEKALKANNKVFELYVYEGANHAFNNDTNAARYDKAAADLAWGRTVAFLKENVAGTA